MPDRTLTKSYTSDRKMLALIEILKLNGTIRFEAEFCEAIGIRKQNLINKKKGFEHFTAGQIQKAIIKYKVNGNWIFGISDTIFLSNMNHQRIEDKKELKLNNN